MVYCDLSDILKVGMKIVIENTIHVIENINEDGVFVKDYYSLVKF